ncbi:MAG: hypothetical protein HQK56_05100, partial [Deltaproteobacteria bacterium]|nr:hypothetical protein [Deltaproteobacteria bacterium]
MRRTHKIIPAAVLVVVIGIGLSTQKATSLPKGKSSSQEAFPTTPLSQSTAGQKRVLLRVKGKGSLPLRVLTKPNALIFPDTSLTKPPGRDNI